jgi:hypothetical protein
MLTVEPSIQANSQHFFPGEEKIYRRGIKKHKICLKSLKKIKKKIPEKLLKDTIFWPAKAVQEGRGNSPLCHPPGAPFRTPMQRKK